MDKEYTVKITIEIKNLDNQIVNSKGHAAHVNGIPMIATQSVFETDDIKKAIEKLNNYHAAIATIKDL